MDDLLIEDDCLDALAMIPSNSIDACVTDPPYGIEFMGKAWDGDFSAGDVAMRRRPEVDAVNTGTSRQGGRQRAGPDWQRRQARDMRAFQAWCEAWASEVLRVLKPGGHLLAFGGTRTYHRLASGIEDAGFEVRDQIGWAYGQGMPKSHNIGKAVDKALGGERQVVGRKGGRYASPKQDFRGGKFHAASGVGTGMFDAITAPATAEAALWEGWGTALKPAWEPICLARKSLDGTVAANALRWGTGGLNIDACRILTDEDLGGGAYAAAGGRAVLPGATEGGRGGTGMLRPGSTAGTEFVQPEGRWPANLAHDGSPEVLGAFPSAPGQQGAVLGTEASSAFSGHVYGTTGRTPYGPPRAGKGGSAARFFYCAKATKAERGAGNDHPTVKPLALMDWLVRMVTPPGGVVLDPFAGSGTTGVAALRAGSRPLLIEREPDYARIARDRLWQEMMG